MKSMRSSISRKDAGRAFRLRPEILFHMAALAAATTIVAMGSRTQSAHGIMPVEDDDPAVSIRRPVVVDQATAEKQIATCEKTWTEAHRRGDAALLRRLLAPEFTFADPTGRVSDTKGYLASVGAASEAASGSAVTLDEITSRDTKTHVYGGTAVVSGETVAHGHRDGQAFQESTRFLRVYVNRDGRWQMVAGQDTPIPAIPATASFMGTNPALPRASAARGHGRNVPSIRLVQRADPCGYEPVFSPLCSPRRR